MQITKRQNTAYQEAMALQKYFLDNFDYSLVTHPRPT